MFHCPHACRQRPWREWQRPHHPNEQGRPDRHRLFFFSFQLHVGNECNICSVTRRTGEANLLGRWMKSAPFPALTAKQSSMENGKCLRTKCFAWTWSCGAACSWSTGKMSQAVSKRRSRIAACGGSQAHFFIKTLMKTLRIGDHVSHPMITTTA